MTERNYSCVMIVYGDTVEREDFVYASSHRAGSKENIKDAINEYHFDYGHGVICEVLPDSVYRIDTKCY